MFSKVMVPVSVSTCSGWRCPRYPIPSNIWWILDFSRVVNMKWHPVVIFIFISLIAREVGYLFVCLWPFVFSFIQQILFEYLPCARHCWVCSTSLICVYWLPIFLLGCFPFFRGVLYIFWKQLLLVICFANILSKFVACLFTLWYFFMNKTS